MLILKKEYTNLIPENCFPWEITTVFFCIWPVATAIFSASEVSLESKKAEIKLFGRGCGIRCHLDYEGNQWKIKE